MKQIMSFRHVAVLGACVVASCATGPYLQKSAVDNGSTLDSYLQLYPGAEKDATAVAVLAGYSGPSAERKNVRVGRLERLDTGDTWSVPSGDAIEILPGQYKAYLSWNEGGARWNTEFVAEAGVVYGLAHDGWSEGYSRNYQKFVPFALPEVSVSDVRGRKSRERAKTVQAHLKPGEASRYVAIWAGPATLSSSPTSTRAIAIMQQRRLSIGDSRGSVERYLGVPQRVSTDADGDDIAEYDEVAFTTEREERRLKSQPTKTRTLRVRYDTEGKIAEFKDL